MKTKTLLRIAMLGAIGYVLMLLEFAVLPTASFLKLNLCDVPSLFAAFSMGPFAGLSVVILENLLHLMQSTSGGVGELANILVSGTLVLTAGFFYRNFHTKKGAFIGLILASVLMVIMAAFANRYILLPMYMPTATEEAFAALIFSAVIPFNCIKAVVVTTLTMLLYKPLSPLLKK